MKNSIITFIITIFICTNIFANSTSSAGIEYQYSSWDEVLNQAKESHQPIFVKTYASYCIPCKMMDKDIYPDPDVATVFNNNFINFKVDMQTKLGSVFNLAYQVSAVPDLLFFNPEGDVILRASGGKSKTEILGLANEAMDILNGKSSPKSYENNYIDASYNQYTVATNNTRKIIDSTIEPKVNLEISNVTVEQKLTENKIAHSDFSAAQLSTYTYVSAETQRLLSTSSDPFSDEIYNVLRKKKNLYKEVGKDEVEKHLIEVVNSIVDQAILDKNITLLEKAINVLNKSDLENKESIELNLSLNYYSETGNWLAFCKTVKSKMIRAKQTDTEHIISATKKIISSSNDLKAIKMASKWMKKLVKSHPSYDANITYSKVLIQQKKYDKALAVAKIANDIAKTEEKTLDESQMLMREIEYIR